MLERGSYIPWAIHFRRYLNRKRENRKWLNKAIDEGPYEFEDFTPSDNEAPRMQKEEDIRRDDLKHYEAEIEAMNLILISIPNDIYNSVDACTTAKPISKDPLTSAIILLARAITQRFSNPTNTYLRTSSNTRNQEIVQGDRVNIQSRNFGNDGRNTRRLYVQEEIIEGNNVLNDAGNIQRTLRSTSLGTAATVQCYNCSEKGHYARNCPKLRVRDSKYFMAQMLLSK
uniref:CCHC-type domain-containing protein n=1 Tax=Tanacetum cinerariifolium TaxID=118510 RepID=A0A6L2N7D7_TANCI|nr:hypothetical protein [Tanacetum cinerariifolium]